MSEMEMMMRETMMTFKEAKKQCRRVGTAHAEGDALRAMYAEMIAFQQAATGGKPEKFYAHLQTVPDDTIAEVARELLRDSWKALDVALA